MQALITALEEQRATSEDLIDRLNRELREERKNFEMLKDDYDMRIDQVLTSSNQFVSTRGSMKGLRMSVNNLRKDMNSGFGQSIFDNRVSMFNKFNRNYILEDVGMAIPEEMIQEENPFRGSALTGEGSLEIQEEAKSEGDKVAKGFSFSDQLPPQEIALDPGNQQPKVES